MTQAVYSTPSGQAAAFSPVQPPRFFFIDALRGLAALWVVLYHAFTAGYFSSAQKIAPRIWELVLGKGYLGVDVFFVLSGFVIAHSVSRYTVSAGFVGRFALRRALRLDPPYWASMILVVAYLFALAIYKGKSSFNFPDGQVIIAHLFYVQDIFRQPALNPAYWTLCLEIQFYLLFCLMMYFAHAMRKDQHDRRAQVAIFAVAALIAAAWPVCGLRTGFLHGLFLPRWYAFLLGVACCWAMQRSIPPAWFCIYAAVIAAAALWWHNLNALTATATALLIHLAGRRKKLDRWLAVRPLLFMGMISYSLYLIHGTITAVFYRVAYRLLQGTPAAEVFWMLPMIAFNIGCAFVFWWLFERTSMEWCRRIKLRPRSVDSSTSESPSGQLATETATARLIPWTSP